eukprot:3041551-Pyramimonas_sp.AAC.1
MDGHRVHGKADCTMCPCLARHWERWRTPSSITLDRQNGCEQRRWKVKGGFPAQAATHEVRVSSRPWGRPRDNGRPPLLSLFLLFLLLLLLLLVILLLLPRSSPPLGQ